MRLLLTAISLLFAATAYTHAGIIVTSDGALIRNTVIHTSHISIGASEMTNCTAGETVIEADSSTVITNVIADSLNVAAGQTVTGNNNILIRGNGGSGTYSSTGDVLADPLFVDAENGDYRLRAGSPAIDAGDNSVEVGYTDYLGLVRRRGHRIDIGAYEYQGGRTGYVRRYLFKAGYKPPLFGDNRKPPIWSNQ